MYGRLEPIIAQFYNVCVIGEERKERKHVLLNPLIVGIHTIKICVCDHT